MVHPAEKGAEIPKYPLHLAREGELLFRVDVLPVVHGPPAVDIPIHRRAIRLETGLGTHVLCQELEGMSAVDRNGGKGVRELPGSRLLPQQEREALPPAKECLIELHRPLEERELLGNLGAEE